MIYTYDCEVFAHDWLVVFKPYLIDDWVIIHNNPTELTNFASTDNIHIGFNSKYYDQFIIKAILGGMDMEDVKGVNDWIINGDGTGWDYPPLQELGFIKFNNVDIMTDMQKGLSLKAIEGHLGLSVKESDVPFDLPRPLTKAQLEQTIKYCKHDVMTTQKIVQLRQDYLNTKIDIGKMAGLDQVTSMGMTNAKLTAALLGAVPKRHNDERKYVYPSNLKREYIPQQVFDFFDAIGDTSIPDDKVFKRKMKIHIGQCQATIAFGGLHGAIPHYVWKEQHNDPTRKT